MVPNVGAAPPPRVTRAVLNLTVEQNNVPVASPTVSLVPMATMPAADREMPVSAVVMLDALVKACELFEACHKLPPAFNRKWPVPFVWN